MINNYRYFLILAQELNISRAAKRLFLTHQALSAYLKNLENECGVRLFNRKPSLSLAPAGEIMLESLKKINQIEMNLMAQFSEINEEGSVGISLGLTEGRYRILAPILLKRFNALYRNIKLDIIYGNSFFLEKKLLNNEIDMYLSGSENVKSSKIEIVELIEENIYLVISDNLLMKYFSNSWEKYKACKEVDLEDFNDIPFVINEKGYKSRNIIDSHLKKLNINLNIIMESTHQDIHYLISNQDLASSFCLSMYKNNINEINKINLGKGKLNLFSISDLHETNILSVVYLKESFLSKPKLDLIDLLRTVCVELTS